MNTETKTCVRCSSTIFYVDGRCKACLSARAKKYKEKNIEKVKEASAKYRRENADKCKAAQIKYHLQNPNKSKEYSRIYRLTYPDRVKEASRKWVEANPEKRKAITNAWAAANPERKKAVNKAWSQANPENEKRKNARRRARKKNAVGQLSAGLSEKLFFLQKGKCPCCQQPLGKDYHLDHIIPLALGGSNEDENIQLLRRRCNQQKNAKHPIDFMQQRGFLL